MKTDKPTRAEEILDNYDLDFPSEKDREYYTDQILKAMEQYRIEGLRDIIKSLGMMTDLVRLKYGNLDKDIWDEIIKSEKILDNYLKQKGLPL